jgi:large subunit ribosomal protein L28
MQPEDFPSIQLYLSVPARRMAPHEDFMAKQCEICGKAPVVGRIHSHANNVRPRRFQPNLQRIRAMVGGGVRYIRVCTRCIRSNKVTKAA